VVLTGVGSLADDAEVSTYGAGTAAPWPAPPQYSPDGRWYWTGMGWMPMLAQPWKGAEYGRPPAGPGSLADPARRLGARLLDWVIFIPVFALLAGIALALVAPHAGRIFPPNNPDPNATTPTPGFVWLYLAVFGAAAINGVAFVAYEVVATVRYGRTLGKRWMKIRIVRTDGSPVRWARSFGRIGLYLASGCLSYLGLLDPLWCLWDNNRQCLHDKAVDTLVVND